MLSLIQKSFNEVLKFLMLIYTFDPVSLTEIPDIWVSLIICASSLSIFLLIRSFISAHSDVSGELCDRNLSHHFISAIPSPLHIPPTTVLSDE